MSPLKRILLIEDSVNDIKLTTAALRSAGLANEIRSADGKPGSVAWWRGPLVVPSQGPRRGWPVASRAVSLYKLRRCVAVTACLIGTCP